MNIKTNKILDPWKHTQTGVGVTMDVNGPDDANTEKILDPTVKSVDLGENVFAEDVFGTGTKVVATREILDAIAHSKYGVKGPKMRTVTVKTGLKQKKDL